MIGSPKVLYAEFTARPGHEERVARMIAELADRVREEPGNVVFAPYRREDDPARFVVHEVYLDDGAFRTHLNAEYGAVFNRELAPLIVEDGSRLTFPVPV